MSIKNFLLSAVKWIFIAGILGGIGFFVWGAQEKIQHIEEGQEEMKNATYTLLEENGELRKNLRSLCQRENTLREYLYLDKVSCAEFFFEEDASASAEEAFPFDSDFIAFFDTLLSSPERMALLSSDEVVSPLPENPLPKVLENTKIGEYFATFSVVFEKDEKDANLIHVKKEGALLADLFWDDQKKAVMANIPSQEKIVALSSFSARMEVAISQKENTTTDRTEILNRLSALHSDENEKGENFLILGHNEGNVDTIILAVINHKKEKITLVSLPRDLWVDDRKINAIYGKFGKELFVKKIEELLGRKISGTAMASMDDFPKLVDSIGGIHYTFDKPLIDPTYKTVDNGEEGTLFFSAGTHHLSGIQALRVARTRHTSSDFARADRQQKILFSALDTIAKKGSAEKVKQVLPFLFKYIKTDMNPVSTVFLILQVKDYTRTVNVMSSRNILSSQMIELPSGQKTYALLPVNEDWSLLKKFVDDAVSK